MYIPRFFSRFTFSCPHSPQIVEYHHRTIRVCREKSFYDGSRRAFTSFARAFLYINKIFNLNINYTISIAETNSTDIFFTSLLWRVLALLQRRKRWDVLGWWVVGRSRKSFFEHQHQRAEGSAMEHTPAGPANARVVPKILHQKLHTQPSDI